MKAIGIFLFGLGAFFLAGCSESSGGPCRYEEVQLNAMVTQSYGKSVWLKLERDDRLVQVERAKVVGEARVGSSYSVLVRELVEGSCVPIVVLEAKPR